MAPTLEKCVYIFCDKLHVHIFIVGLLQQALYTPFLVEDSFLQSNVDM